jgi:hypothetical protein
VTNSNPQLVERLRLLLDELDALPEHLLLQVRYSEPGLKLRSMLEASEYAEALSSPLPVTEDDVERVESLVEKLARFVEMPEWQRFYMDKEQGALCIAALTSKGDR